MKKDRAAERTSREKRELQNNTGVSLTSRFVYKNHTGCRKESLNIKLGSIKKSNFNQLPLEVSAD